jgi:hypothetical protein
MIKLIKLIVVKLHTGNLNRLLGAEYKNVAELFVLFNVSKSLVVFYVPRGCRFSKLGILSAIELFDIGYL